MILDSSAIVAIILQEPNHEILIDKITSTNEIGIGAPTLVECTIVLSARLNRDARALMMRFLDEANITILPFNDAHYSVALGAWLKYGKGRHPAALNFGDCLAYAVAKLAKQPLLMVGDDFPQTDLLLA